MISLLLIISCFAHRTNLTGIIDNAGIKNCVIELSSGEFVTIKSELCKSYKEGDKIVFYGRKK